jgi:ABC-type multidrug transport system permease subunit
LPIADEDGGTLGGRIEAQLANDERIRVRHVGSSAEAERLVRDKVAGSALVIPAGTAAAIAEGRPARILLYTDPVKYLERLNVRVRILETRSDLAREERERVLERLRDQRQRLREQVEDFDAAVARARASAEELDEEIDALRRQAAAQMNDEAVRLQQDIERQIAEHVETLVAQINATAAARMSALRQPAREYLEALTQSRRSFEEWFAELRRLANRRADEIPPPPEFPEPPPALIEALDEPTAAIDVPSDIDIAVEVSPPSLPEPSAAGMIDLRMPELDLPAPEVNGAELSIEEVTIDGGPTTVNAFDQNVPGFSITFLLLGMLLGVSLGVLDERDWGTFDRVRTLPVPARNILIGKLTVRFGVGVVQMILLFIVGYYLFDISLGPEPWALMLPIIGIAFAGTAFGLIIAAVAHGRDAVLPFGSIVIVTMAAIGGCWWPIDLEPPWMRTVALAFPTTWAMEAFNDLMIRWRGADAAYRPTVVLLSYGLVYLAVGLSLFRRRITRT